MTKSNRLQFTGNFTQQESIPEVAIQRAVKVMQSGRLHRYNVAADEVSETALLEEAFCAYTGARYCVAVTSGGYALHIALRAAGLKYGEKVLTNAFTLSPVPGAIVNAGGQPVLVETTDQLVIDLGDLEQKIRQSGARFLLLSHMRGHLVDMDALVEITERHGVILIEDCAHTMGASWNGVASGRHGLAACYSTQTYKHINSGEGGLIISDDEELIARAIVHSGSYMLYGRHTAAPAEEVFQEIRLQTPNMSGRMDNLRASILRPQLDSLDENVQRWNERYRVIESILSRVDGINLPIRPDKELFVGSSIQFSLPLFQSDDIRAFLAECLDRGVELKWFGPDEPSGYTSRHVSWHYVEQQSLPKTDAVLGKLCDMRIPLTFSVADCELIAHIITEVYAEIAREREDG